MSNAVETSPERLFTQEMVSSDISFIAFVIYDVYQGFRLCFKFYKLSPSFKTDWQDVEYSSRTENYNANESHQPLLYLWEEHVVPSTCKLFIKHCFTQRKVDMHHVIETQHFFEVS